jgi:hypothetical protein
MSIEGKYLDATSSPDQEFSTQVFEVGDEIPVFSAELNQHGTMHVVEPEKVFLDFGKGGIPYVEKAINGLGLEYSHEGIPGKIFWIDPKAPSA